LASSGLLVMVADAVAMTEWVLGKKWKK